MKKLFLDPQKPLDTCSSTICQDCALSSYLQCYFNISGQQRFFGIVFHPIILAGIGIARINSWLLLPWITLVFVYVGFFEIWVTCAHYPHYAEPGNKALQCWADDGSPKQRKYKPGPMSSHEKVIFFIGHSLMQVIP